MTPSPPHVPVERFATGGACHVAFAGGGSGGHLFPGLAIAERLRARRADCRLTFVGAGRELERRAAAAAGLGYHAVASGPLAGIRFRTLASLAALARGAWQAGRWLRAERPDVVVGLGGFASVPLGLAAAAQGVPLMLVEQNLRPGRANRLLSRWAETVCLPCPAAGRGFSNRTRLLVTGTPVRAGFSPPGPESHRGSAPQRLLVLGGSQGSASLNRAVPAALGPLAARLREWRIAHQTGAGQTAEVVRRYAEIGLSVEAAPFFEDLPQRMREATLVVTRAGAATLAELAVSAAPTLLVPLVPSADDHQRANALYLAALGAAEVVDPARGAVEAELTRQLACLSSSPERRTAVGAALGTLARPAAAEAVAELIFRTVGGSPALPCPARAESDHAARPGARR